jgi:hypothetical protein
MEQVFYDVNRSMVLLKISGRFFLFLGLAYFILARPVFNSKWKSVLGLGCILGLINAGLVISLVKIAFCVTPAFLMVCIVLYGFNKFPLYRVRHLLALLLSFTFSSFIFFIIVAGTFFHLAVEGRI